MDTEVAAPMAVPLNPHSSPMDISAVSLRVASTQRLLRPARLDQYADLNRHERPMLMRLPGRRRNSGRPKKIVFLPTLIFHHQAVTREISDVNLVIT
jgi:hypothetical protein